MHHKTKEELEDALKRQIGHLRRSCAAFDAGEMSEGERLAVTCYTLLHDSPKDKRITGLLGRFGMRSKMSFLDSSRQDHFDNLRKKNRENFLHIGLPMATIKFGKNGSTYAPLFENLKNIPNATIAKVKFQQWWEGKVYENANRYKLSRKNLVSTLRNQDGGGHIDDHIRDGAYHFLSMNPLQSFSVDMETGQSTPTRNAHWATMRQVAWELDESLKLIGL